MRMTPLLALCVGLAALTGMAAGQGPGDDAIGKITEEWGARRAKLASAYFEMTEEKTLHVEFYKVAAMEGGAKHVPEKDVTTQYQHKVTIRGEEFRHSYSGKKWDASSGKFQQIEYVGIRSKGRESIQWNYPDGSRRPDASERPAGKQSLLDHMSLVPVLLYAQGNSPEGISSRKIEAYEVSAKRVPVEGTMCAAVSRGILASGERDVMLLDPAGGYLPKRVDTYIDDKLVFRLNARYSAGLGGGATLPSAWTYVSRLRNGNPLQSGSMTVTKAEINSEFPPDVFSLNYKPGTLVMTSGAGGVSASVARDDGTPGVAQKLTPNTTYESLVEANQSEDGGHRAIYVAVAVSVVLAGVFFAVWRRRVGSR